MNTHLPLYEVDKWQVSEFVEKRLLPVVGHHPYPIDELTIMVGAVIRVRPTHIFDWGTNIGKSARVFHETAKHFRIKTQVHTTDLPVDVEHVEHAHALTGKLVRNLTGVCQHFGDGLEISMNVAGTAPAGSRFLFFADGDHAYTSVRHELLSIAEHFPDASVLVHDTFYQEQASGYNIGPWLSIQEIIKIMPGHYQIIDTNSGLPGITLLYRHLSQAVL